MDSDGMSRGGRLDEDEDAERPRAGHDRRVVGGGADGEDRRAPPGARAPTPGAESHEPPAFGVMLHLLGAVALALAALLWGALLLFGAVESTGLRVLGIFAGLTLAVAWFAWLVRATMGREFRDEEPETQGPVPPDDDGPPE